MLQKAFYKDSRESEGKTLMRELYEGKSFAPTSSRGKGHPNLKLTYKLFVVSALLLNRA